MTNTVTKISRVKSGPRRGYYGVGALIVLLVVGHFAAQLTFIAAESWNIDVSSVAAVPTGGQTLAVLPAEVASNMEMQDLGDLILNQYHFGEEDVAAKHRGGQKNASDGPLALVRAEQSSKEKAGNEARKARLRRAEKILTGF